MSEIMKKYEELAVRKAEIQRIKKMLQKGCTKEFILDLDYSEDVYTEAEAELFQSDPFQNESNINEL